MNGVIGRLAGQLAARWPFSSAAFLPPRAVPPAARSPCRCVPRTGRIYLCLSPRRQAGERIIAGRPGQAAPQWAGGAALRRNAAACREDEDWIRRAQNAPRGRIGAICIRPGEGDMHERTQNDALSEKWRENSSARGEDCDAAKPAKPSPSRRCSPAVRINSVQFPTSGRRRRRRRPAQTNEMKITRPLPSNNFFSRRDPTVPRRVTKFLSPPRPDSSRQGVAESTVWPAHLGAGRGGRKFLKSAL